MALRHIILDCDPGIDDSVAICLAAAHQDRLKIHGIVSVAGNQVLERVTDNACRLADFFGLAVPVAEGAAAPLIRKTEPAADIHGVSGLGNCVLPESKKQTEAVGGVEFMYRTIMALPAGERMTLVPIGPLTNIALLLKTFPKAAEKIEEICFMGGAVVGGNVTPTAEFNIWADPEAARIVVSSGLPLVMCGLDVTNRSGLTRDQVAGLASSSKKVSRAIGQMLDFYFHTKVYEACDRVAIHDAVTLMYLLHPEIYKGERMHLTVDCSEGLNRGMTVCDSRRYGGEDWQEVTVLTDTDEALFNRYLMEAIESFGETDGGTP